MIGRMYQTMLFVHSWLRWATLVMAIGATISALRPVAPDATRAPGRWWDTLFMLAVDLQMAAGLFLYFGLSPATKVAMNNIGAAMGNPSLRFWAIEHAGGMFVALILVRVGRVLALNARTAAAAQKRRLVCFALATGVMLLVIPWPGFMNGRPLVRW
jgi:hypothetical protein